MTPKWPNLASLAQKICTLWCQFFDAFFASKGYPFKNIFKICIYLCSFLCIPNVIFISDIDIPKPLASNKISKICPKELHMSTLPKHMMHRFNLHVAKVA